MHEDTGFYGGIHSISNRLCVYLGVWGQWRNEKLAFYENAEKRPQREGQRRASFTGTVSLLKMATRHEAGGPAGCCPHRGRSCFESADPSYGAGEVSSR